MRAGDMRQTYFFFWPKMSGLGYNSTIFILLPSGGLSAFLMASPSPVYFCYIQLYEFVLLLTFSFGFISIHSTNWKRSPRVVPPVDITSHSRVALWMDRSAVWHLGHGICRVKLPPRLAMTQSTLKCHILLMSR